MTSAEVLTTIANLRGSTEYRVANDYTYPQALHVVETYVKDRMLVVRQVAKTFGGRGKDETSRAAEKHGEDGKIPGTPFRAPGTDHRGLYPWYDPPYRTDRRGKRRSFNKVVPLDGPMKTLEPYLGKGKIRRGGMKVSGRHQVKKAGARAKKRKKGK